MQKPDISTEEVLKREIEDFFFFSLSRVELRWLSILEKGKIQA